MKQEIPWNLIIAQLRQMLSEEESILFNDWLEIDDNRKLFKQIETVWANVQKKSGAYEPDMKYYWKELTNRIHLEQSENKDVIFLPRSPKFLSIKHLYRVVAAACVLIALTFSGAYYLGKSQKTENTVSQTYASLTGKSKVILPDGTEVWLHSHSTLSYNTANARDVIMKGEAFFCVKKEARKPFVVHANGVSVLVHGTKFNVNTSASSNNVLVSLCEGSVSMKVANKNVYLKPGEEGLYDKLHHSLEVNAGDVNFAKSWTNDQLRFEKKSLRYVCRYLSKWYSVNIYIDDAISDNQSYTFTLRNETLEEIIRIMARMNAINYHFSEDNKLTLTSK